MRKVAIFDLDDTLYKEIDYVKSAFDAIARYIFKEVKVDASVVYDEMMKLYFRNKDVFGEITKKYRLTSNTANLIELYRCHQPNIRLHVKKKFVLEELKSQKVDLGLLTDGRGLQQRNKIKSLELEPYFTEIVISEEFGSEKPNEANYRHFELIFGKANYYYIGDNIKKDFIAPNNLDWTTICLLDNGYNIHKQDFTLPLENQPAFKIKEFTDLRTILMA
ncbi:MAG: HAD-IA family hydrolase [Flavobacteriaceae bacterium]